MVKRVVLDILKLVLVSFVSLTAMGIIVSFLQDDQIGGTAAEPLLMILWELIFVFFYTVFYKKSLYNDFINYSEKPPFDARETLRRYFNLHGKRHLIIFSVIAAISYFGVRLKIDGINVLGVLSTMAMPIAGIIGRTGRSLGVCGLLSHIALIPPSMLLAQFIHHRRMIKKSLS